MDIHQLRDPNYIRKLLTESEKLVESSRTAQRRNRKLCIGCREKMALDESLRCEVCGPIHNADMVRQRANRVLHRENKPSMEYDSGGRLVYSHRVLMERHLGRPLESYEAVFFRNGDKTDCRIENLILGLKQGIPFDSLVCPHCSEKYYEARND